MSPECKGRRPRFVEVMQDPWAGPSSQISRFRIIAMYNSLDSKTAQLEGDKPDLLPLVTSLPEQTDDELNYLCQADWDDAGSWGDTRSVDDTSSDESFIHPPRRGSSSRIDEYAVAETQHVEDVTANTSSEDQNYTSQSRRIWENENIPLMETQHAEHGTWWLPKAPLEPNFEERRKLRLRNVLDDRAEDRDQDRLEALRFMRDSVVDTLGRYDQRIYQETRFTKYRISDNRPLIRQHLLHPMNASEMETDDSEEEDSPMEEHPSVEEGPVTGKDSSQEAVPLNRVQEDPAIEEDPPMGDHLVVEEISPMEEEPAEEQHPAVEENPAMEQGPPVE